MKINKEQQKILIQKIKMIAKKEGYKVRDQFIFKKIGDNFVNMTYIFIENAKVVFDIGIKKYIYDDIFWEIMDMSENSKE